MGDIALRVEGLGKQYHLGAQRQGYKTLRDSLSGIRPSSLRAMLRRAKRAESKPTFWALKDVSFEVKRGEVVGIIGRNGAGKSTLLKILSRITEPTEGGVDIHGRVGSLLEVGTGFNPELTGRENVYLNGAILGMRRAEIVRKFDEIVEFAEVEKFIDTQVKHYSSGMYMRLAFAVAAHLEPEILIVDEVLAVGDAQFQKKCLGKMGEVSKAGRTVLFVSHNMQAVQALCSRGVLLRQGGVALDGPVNRVITAYLDERRAATGAERQRFGHGFSLDAIRITPTDPRPGDDIDIVLELSADQPVRLSDLALIVYSGLEDRVGVIDFRPRRPPHDIPFAARLTARCRVSNLRLVEGEYRVGLYLVSSNRAVIVDAAEVARLTVYPAPATEGFAGYPAEHRGVVEFNYSVGELRSDAPTTAVPDEAVHVTP